ncbi:MAG TPA: MFS transporter [Methylomirabilota bacterium]|nr:MFS transporter [Methylomirabilota bacterium]
MVDASAAQSLAPQPLPVHRALRLSIWDGIFANLYANLTGGVFLVGYALALKASEVQIGLLAAFPLLANIIQPFSTYLIERLGRRRPLALLGGACARLLWLVLIALSLWLSSRRSLLYWSMWIVALSQVGTAVNNLAWMSWMADLVREEMRGRYFGLRNAALGVAALLASLAGGFFLDIWKESHPRGEMDALRVLFFLGVACGVTSLVIQSRIYEPPLHEGDGSLPFRRRLLLPFYDCNFRRFLMFTVAWNFAVYFTAPFFAVYMLKSLKLSYTAVTAYAVLSSLADLASAQLWGRLSDRETNKPILVMASFFAALIPYGWLFTDRDSAWLFSLLHLEGGLFWAGIRLCTGNLVLKISPAANRSIYFSVFNAVAGLTAVIAPIIGGFALKHLPALLQAVALSWNPFFVVFFVSSTLRLAALPLLAQVSEPRERSVWQAVRIIRNVRAFTTTMGFNLAYHFWLWGKRRTEMAVTPPPEPPRRCEKRMVRWQKTLRWNVVSPLAALFRRVPKPRCPSCHKWNRVYLTGGKFLSTCVHCGAPLESRRPPALWGVLAVIGAGMLVLAAIPLLGR